VLSLSVSSRTKQPSRSEYPGPCLDDDPVVLEENVRLMPRGMNRLSLTKAPKLRPVTRSTMTARSVKAGIGILEAFTGRKIQAL